MHMEVASQGLGIGEEFFGLLEEIIHNEPFLGMRGKGLL
jgi:hypothetical protein